MNTSMGLRFREAVEEERPLQVAGAINAYSAKLAEREGFKAIYLSGAGVANASYGIPDLGRTTLDDVLVDAKRITGATDIPLLVDCDTGWGDSDSITRTVREMTDANVAAIHLEDQVDAKRCGHRPNKQLVTVEQMCDRVRTAAEARRDPHFVIIARTDAAAVEGFDAAIARAAAYVEAGADMIFAEALTSLTEFKRFAQSMSAPVLANMTEFGKSPLLTVSELRIAGVRLALYPLTAFRAMSAAATKVYATVRQQGTQAELMDDLQTREELYEVLNYYEAEQQVDDERGRPRREGATEVHQPPTAGDPS